MPKSLYYIGDSAFSGCKMLEEIDLSAVKEIGGHVFEYTGLTYVNLSALEKAGRWSFADTIIDFSDLEYLPKMEVGDSFAHNQYWMEYGKDKPGNTFWVVDGVLLSGQCCSGEVKIPGTVKRIAADAFYGNTKITSVSIPDSVTEIGEGAFWYCTRLKSVRMEDSVTTLGRDAFYHCSRLTEIRLSNQIEVILGGMFEKCFRLKNVTLPEKITEVAGFWIAPENQFTLPAGIRGIDWFGERETVFYVTDINQVSVSPTLKRLAKHYDIRELALTDTKLTLRVGEKYPLRFNSGAKAAWKSSKKSVATVGQTGNIYAKKPGTTVITATIYGEEYSCTVKVVER